jgi:hypothetical protein
MQRTAQDWIVLTELTNHRATAVGIVMALQFGPQVLLLPLTGFAADHLDPLGEPESPAAPGGPTPQSVALQTPNL